MPFLLLDVFCICVALDARRIVQPIFFLERKGDQRDDLSDERLYLAGQNPDLRVQDARADTSAMMKMQRGVPPL
jgi:hypothetical protein